MKRPWVYLVAVAASLSMLMPAGAARDDEATPVQTRLKRVALFKNGLAFFVREGTLSGDSRAVLIGPFAAPSHGTFWVSCPQRAGLAQVVARTIEVEEEVEARTIPELLRANIGEEVSLGISTEPGLVHGVIRSFATDHTPDVSPHQAYAIGRVAGRDRSIQATRGLFMTLETDDGIEVVDPLNYSRVLFERDDPATTLVRKMERTQLEALFDGPPRAGDWLSATYLAKGMTWAPSYLIDISDPTDARLTAKALILNEAEDLDGSHVDLITGFPNLQFADVLSPIAMKDDLASFIAALGRGRSRAGEVSVMTQNVLYMERRAYAAEPGEIPEYGAADAGQVAEDLFLYPIEDVTLAAGEIGYYPLFTEAVPYTEVHQWEIPDYINERDRYGETRREQRDEPEAVWHSIRMDNTTTVPWTTAPAQLVKNGQIIGQDTLKYTPPKGEMTVRITRAVSIRAEQSEQEIDRQREAVRMYGDYFDRVTIKGTLRVTNYKDKPISLEIEKTLSGDVKEMSREAEDVTLARGLQRMNPIHHLTWEFDLPSGEAEEITYVYEALIRR